MGNSSETLLPPSQDTWVLVRADHSVVTTGVVHT